MHWMRFLQSEALLLVGVVQLSQIVSALQTKGVPIEEVSNVVRSHWLWRRVAYKGGVIPPLHIKVVDGVPIEFGKHSVDSV